MDATERRMTIPAIIDRIEEICEFTDEVARSAGMSEDAVYHCHLSVEEVCTNIIEHGYKFKGENEFIEVVCTPLIDRLRITLIDDAAPFNPLSRPDPDPKAPLSEREGGGWGIFFVKKFMDRIYYKYEHQQNHLIIEKIFR